MMYLLCELKEGRRERFSEVWCGRGAPLWPPLGAGTSPAPTAPHESSKNQEKKEKREDLAGL
jgi:hypothetical protein